MERNCVDCGKPSKTFARCYPCKMKKECKVNNCKHCNAECGTYTQCFKCFKTLKDVETAKNQEKTPAKGYKIARRRKAPELSD